MNKKMFTNIRHSHNSADSEALNNLYIRILETLARIEPQAFEHRNDCELYGTHLRFCRTIGGESYWTNFPKTDFTKYCFSYRHWAFNCLIKNKTTLFNMYGFDKIEVKLIQTQIEQTLKYLSKPWYQRLFTKKPDVIFWKPLPNKNYHL